MKVKVKWDWDWYGKTTPLECPLNYKVCDYRLEDDSEYHCLYLDDVMYPESSEIECDVTNTLKFMLENES